MPVARKDPRQKRESPDNQGYAAEYRVLHGQRLAVIRSYNVWYGFGHAVAHAYFWLLLFLSLDLSSKPLLAAAAIVASLIVWFAYRVVLIIDREVVRLYPRVVYLEILMGLDFYRDYLRNRPRGDTERSFIERCEQIETSPPSELWTRIYGLFKEHDFPADRRITAHFKRAAWLSVALFWIIAAIILLPLYLPWTA